MVFLDEMLTLYTLCYSLDANHTDVCAQNRTEQLIVQNNQLEYENDTLLWLKLHCSSINTDDFVLNDETSTTEKNFVFVFYIDCFVEKCLSIVTGPEFVEGNTTIAEVNATESLIENANKTVFQEGNSKVC